MKGPRFIFFTREILLEDTLIKSQTKTINSRLLPDSLIIIKVGILNLKVPSEQKL